MGVCLCSVYGKNYRCYIAGHGHMNHALQVRALCVGSGHPNSIVHNRYRLHGWQNAGSRVQMVQRSL